MGHVYMSSITFEMILFAAAIQERHLLLSALCDGFLIAVLWSIQPRGTSVLTTDLRQGYIVKVRGRA